MIRVAKPIQAPAILRNRGADETAHIRAQFDADPESYRNGTKTFDFKSSIYGAKSVKNKLIAAQHRKCCFCESRITHVSFGDVEHFRPKGGYSQDADDHLHRPGYYWLAYDWTNLFLSCQLCNQRFKKNLFPIENTYERAQSHHDDIDRERPSFLHPSNDDPERHVGFRDELPFAIDGDSRGKITIEWLRLDRDELNEMRRDCLEMIKLLALIARLDIPESPEATTQIEAMQRDEAQYAGMARAYARAAGL